MTPLQPVQCSVSRFYPDRGNLLPLASFLSWWGDPGGFRKSQGYTSGHREKTCSLPTERTALAKEDGRSSFCECLQTGGGVGTGRSL